MARFRSRRSRRGRKLSHKKRRGSTRRSAGSRRRVSFKRRAAPAKRSSAKSRIRRIQRSIILSDSGADIRQLRKFAKEESHIWKPLPETTVIDDDFANGLFSSISGNFGGWPTGIEGTGYKIVHFNHLGINNFRRLHSMQVMGCMPINGANYDLSESALRNYIFFGGSTHKITLRNLERQTHTLRISKLRCKRNLKTHYDESEFLNRTVVDNGQSNVSSLFQGTLATTQTQKWPEGLMWSNWLSRQDQDINAIDRAEEWLRPNVKSARHPCVRSYYKVMKEATVRLLPGQTITMNYTLPPKLIRYRDLLSNATLKGDINFMVESWGDLAVLRASTDTAFTLPNDNLKMPVNMDFDSGTLTIATSSGVNYSSPFYSDSVFPVVRDHGEFAILHEWCVKMQYIPQKHNPTVSRHEYPRYNKEITAGFYRQTFAPQDEDTKADIAV